MRGTKWLVQDTCTTTLTRVAQGVVEVEDFAKKKKVLVKKGKRYTRAPEEALAQNCATPSSGVEAWAYSRRGMRPAR